MTKYEWEHELKKNIHRLPGDEIARVLDYYNEMFEDNIERGKTEREIIREFGNPVDVADKILSEYDGELLPEDGRISTPFDTPHSENRGEAESPVHDEIFEGHGGTLDRSGEDSTVKGDSLEQKSSEVDGDRDLSEREKRDIKVTLFVVLNVITGFALVVFAAILWVVLLSLTVAGGGMGIGGAYTVIVSFGPMFTGALGAGLAQLGMGISAIGLGVLFIVCCIKLMRVYGRVTKKIFNGIFKVGKKEKA